MTTPTEERDGYNTEYRSMARRSERKSIARDAFVRRRLRMSSRFIKPRDLVRVYCSRVSTDRPDGQWRQRLDLNIPRTRLDTPHLYRPTERNSRVAEV